MATSGTYNAVANFNIAQLIDEAFMRCKIDPSELTAKHTESARMSLDLMFIDWINDGVQQFIIDLETEVLSGTSADISFVTPVGTIDILDMVYRDQNGQDIMIKPISREDYLYINDKEITGQPLSYFVDKTAMPPTIFLWPVQNITGTSVVYNRLKQIQDVGSPINTPDVTVTYKEAICACLAAKLAEKYADSDKFPTLEADLLAKAERVYDRAKDQDRDRAAYVIKPRLGRRYPYGV